MEAKPVVLDATDRAYESNPFKLLSPSIEAFQVMAIEFLKLLGVTILVYLVAVIPSIIGIVSISTNHASTAAIGLIAISILLLIVPGLYIGYAFTKLNLAAARGQKLPWRETLPKRFGQAWNLAWTSLLAGLIILAGIIAFIVPGIFFTLWYSQVTYVVVDEGLTGMAALKRSKELVHLRLFDMLGIYGMNQIPQLFANIPFFGSIIAFVYAIITMPLGSIRYIQLTQLSDEDRKTIPTNMWNYLLFYIPIALFVVIFIGFILLAAAGHK